MAAPHEQQPSTLQQILEGLFALGASASALYHFIRAHMFKKYGMATLSRLTKDVGIIRRDFDVFRDVELGNLKAQIQRERNSIEGKLETLSERQEGDRKETLRLLGRMSDDFKQSYDDLKRHLET